MNVPTGLLSLFGGAVLAGCTVLAPQPDYSKFFILSPLSDPASSTRVSTSSGQRLIIGLGPIDFPDYLRRLEVVTRTSPNELHLSAVDRWGEPLDRNFSRVLSENLSRLLNTEQIEKFPWTRRTQIDYQVMVDVLRFETTADNQAQLAARWIINDGSSGKDLYASETITSTPVGKGQTAAATALSADLATMSRDIASQVIDLSSRRIKKS
jgi:uncharacterized lipoprotein YmbA